jgi:hypothetical protein
MAEVARTSWKEHDNSGLLTSCDIELQVWGNIVFSSSYPKSKHLPFA